MVITSVSNPVIKQLKKLKMKKYRQKEELFLVEGHHLVEEALAAGVLVQVIYEDGHEIDFENTIKVSREVMNVLDETKNSQGIMGLCRMEQKQKFQGNGLLVDGVSDPGNLGAIIRSADAFGVDFVVLGHGTCDLYNPKVLRSTQGSLFHLPIFQYDLTSFIRDYEGEVYGTSLSGTSLKEMQIKQPFCFIVGNEGRGVDSKLLELTKDNIYIEMPGQSESLNVAVATSIVLYELLGR